MPVKTFETDKFGEATGKTFGQWLKFAEREKLSTLPRDQIAAGFSKAGVPGFGRRHRALESVLEVRAQARQLRSGIGSPMKATTSQATPTLAKRPQS